jgi:hypothetical protein
VPRGNIDWPGKVSYCELCSATWPHRLVWESMGKIVTSSCAVPRGHIDWPGKVWER